MRRKILIAGGRGMLGSDLTNRLSDPSSRFDVVSCNHDALDITNEECVDYIFKKIKPHIVINCAAYTNVVKAEEENKEAFLLNHIGVDNLARACVTNKAKLIHFSSDYVFDGTDYIYHEEAKHNPLNTYGMTKSLGDKTLELYPNLDYMLLRVQWLFGKNGRNFVNTLNEAKRRGVTSLDVVDDQFGRPTSTLEIARNVEELIHLNFEGVLNIGPQDSCSWSEFAKEIMRDTNVTIVPCKSDQVASKVTRPKNNILSMAKARSIGLKLKSWREHLSLYTRS